MAEPEKIVKRNGDVVDFNKYKICNAIEKASKEDPNNLLSHRSLRNLTDEVAYIAGVMSKKEGKPPTVEGVQDIVEKTLIKYGLADIAKRYIIYRQTHARIRETTDFLMETFQELNCKDASDIDIKRENANIDADTAMGMMLKYGSTSANFFVDNYILPKEMADAHRDGAVHYHDKDFYLLTETCCQIDLLKLFKDGFHTGHGTLREPSNIISAAALACIAIQSNQNDQHGGQAVPHFDYCMAPYVQKTYEKEFEDALDIYDELIGDNDYSSARTFACDRAMERTKRLTYQAMEALIHNLNTMHCLPSYEKLWVYDTKEKVLDLLCIEELYECFEENRYQVISLNRNTMQTEFKRISHVTRKDKNRRLIEIKTNYGQKASTTDNHLWLTNEDGIVVDKRPEDISSVIMPRNITMPESIPYIKLQSLAKIRSDTPFNENKLEVTELLAELIGYYVADGSVIGGSSLSFATYHKVDYDRLVYLVRKCLGNDVSYQGCPRMIAGVKMQEHRFSVGTYLARNIKAICGDGAEQKRVPNEILISSDAKIRLAFLNAYFSCDAKVSGYIEATSVSYLLIKQIQFMLLSFGVVPKFSIFKNGHQYRLVIPGLAASKIGLKLKKTPKFELQREDLDYAQKRLRSKYQLAWFKDLTHRHTKNGKNQIRYDEAIKACKKHGIDYNADEILKTINVMTIPTETPSISYSGECFVYDLGVEDNENFMTEDGLFVHNSRAGAQCPFSSLNYGTDTSWQGRLVIKCLLDATQAGLGNGETPIFPVQIFKVKEGINYNEGDPNYDLFKLAMKTSAERLFPNFSFLDAPFNKEFYTKPGDWNHEVAYMGCFQKDQVITYKVNDVLFVESGSRAFNRLSSIFRIQLSGISEYIDVEKFNVTVYDTVSGGFVGVKKIIRNPEPKNWRLVKLTSGRSIVVTDDHYLPVQGKGRTRVSNLEIGDEVPCVWTQYSESDIQYDSQKAWLLGMLLCDGAYSTGIVISVGNDEFDLVLKIEAVCGGIGFDTVYTKQIRGEKGIYYDVRINTGSSKASKSKLTALFGGEKKADRHIPNQVFSWDKDAKIGFLAGMFDADGYVEVIHGKSFALTLGSTNEELAIQQMLLFQSLGVRARIYRNHYKSCNAGAIRYAVYAYPDETFLEKFVLYVSCNKKRERISSLKPSAIFEENFVCKVESINTYVEHDFCYDLETVSDRFDVSGICSHNCRTRVMANIDKSHEVTCGRGNLSFTTINLPRIGLESKGNTDTFFEILTDRIDLVIRQLLHRYKIQCKKKVKNYPFLMGNGIWIDSDKLDWEDTIESVIKYGTLTIGFIGLAECLVALTGKHHGESEESQKLGLYIIKYMRTRCDRACKEYNLNFSLIATPSEGLAGRFVPLDRKRFGTLKGITDREYYTNSFHVPVYYPIKAFKKIQIEAPYHALTNGGHITYVELDGDTAKNPEAFEKIIRYMHDCGVGYGSINHPIDRDPVCGYTGVIDDVCPRCGRREGESVSVEKLRELRKKFSNVPKY